MSAAARSGGSRFAHLRHTIALAGAATFLALLAGELLLRAVLPAEPARPLPEVRYEAHPIRRFTLRPAQRAYSYGVAATIDDRGFRSNGHHSTPDDSAYTVVALGDSFTFGLGVPDSCTWPAVLEQQLALTTGRPVRVINAGTISYGVFQEMHLLREHFARIKPDLIVHALYWNDYQSASSPGKNEPLPVDSSGYLAWDVPHMGTSHPFPLNLIAASRIVGTGSRLLRALFATPEPYQQSYESLLEGEIDPDNWEPVRRFYADLGSLADSAGSAVWAIILPVQGILGRSDAAAQAYPQLARETLKAAGIPFLDSFELLRADVYSRDLFLHQGADSHLGVAGYEKIGRALAAQLAAQLRLGDTR